MAQYNRERREVYQSRTLSAAQKTRRIYQINVATDALAKRIGPML